jgi:hypothetical protein
MAMESSYCDHRHRNFDTCKAAFILHDNVPPPPHPPPPPPPRTPAVYLAKQNARNALFTWPSKMHAMRIYFYSLVAKTFHFLYL